MIFSLSKFTGHSSSRLGWALVKDEDIARKMSMFIGNTSRPSTLSQYEAINLFDNIIVNGTNFFDYMMNGTKSYWNQINGLFSSTTKFQIQSANGTQFAFIECYLDSATCDQSFPNDVFGSGNQYGLSNHYRINLLITNTRSSTNRPVARTIFLWAIRFKRRRFAMFTTFRTKYFRLASTFP